MSSDGLGPPAPCEAVLDKIDFILRVEPISVGVDQIEPLLEDLLQYMTRHEECRVVLEVRFEQLLDTLPGGAVEVLQYCMHELKWDSVEAYAKACLTAEPNVTRRRQYERVVESFGDDWVERDLYFRYDGGATSDGL